MTRSLHVKSKRRRVIFVPHVSDPSTTETCPMHAAVAQPNYQTSDTEIDLELSTQSKASRKRIAHGCPKSQRGVMENNAHTAFPIGSKISGVPSLHTNWPPIRDELETETSDVQDETVRECLPFLNGSAGSQISFNDHGAPALAREEHIQFLHSSLEKMPSKFVGFDASRPWAVYWALTALSLLGEDIAPYRER